MGREKAFLEIEGEPLWRQQIETLRALEPAELFIAGPPRHEWSEHEVIADAQPETGPLAGLVAGLRRARASLLVVLAVDLPMMPASYLRQLLEGSSAECGVVPLRGDFFEPLAAVYPSASLALAEANLRDGVYALQDFARACVAQGLVRPSPVAPEDEALFANLNRPADVRALAPS